MCVTLGNVGATPQDETDFSFCAVGCEVGVAASCTAPLECSGQARFTTAEGERGICAPATIAGAACGASADELLLCTSEQTCAVAQGENAGVCQ